MTSPAHSARPRATAVGWGLRAVTAAALVIDAVVHLRLADTYQLAFPGGIGGGSLFRIEAAVAIIAAVYVLVRGSRASYAVAVAVALSAFVAVVLSRYVQVPAIGPIPSLYEPIWFFEKSLSAAAEGVGAVTAAVGFAITATSRSRSRRPAR